VISYAPDVEPSAGVTSEVEADGLNQFADCVLFSDHAELLEHGLGIDQRHTHKSHSIAVQVRTMKMQGDTANRPRFQRAVVICMGVTSKNPIADPEAPCLRPITISGIWRRARLTAQ